MEAACVVVRLSVLGWVSLLLTELAIVTDRPSRIQAVPRPRTRRVWNGDQRRRSRGGRDRAPDRLLLLRGDGGHGGTSSADCLVVGVLAARPIARYEHDGALGFEKD